LDWGAHAPRLPFTPKAFGANTSAGNNRHRFVAQNPETRTGSALISDQLLEGEFIHGKNR
jgi:hypothetical protein